MYLSDKMHKTGKRIRFILVAFLLLFLPQDTGYSEIFFFPLLSYVGKNKETNIYFSLYQYQTMQMKDTNYLALSKSEMTFSQEDIWDQIEESGDGATEEEQYVPAFFKEHGFFAEESVPCFRDTFSFTKHEKQEEYDLAQFREYETLLHSFYIIDADCLAGVDLFNVEDLNGRDLRLEKMMESPQILIYHTHSKEKYKETEDGENGGVIEAGELLANILREDYGYQVIHCTEEFDTVRDDAYAKAYPRLEQILSENPGIEVVIDLHRDSGNPNREMTIDMDGEKYARFMFFNGISRSKKLGNIEYLKNDNLKDNLAFSFQMQKVLGEYYPGLTRKIYIKQYRYNMHLCKRTLLIELGDENNTLEEAKRSCYPIAHALDLVLNGKE